MNCARARSEILLETSGELSRRRLRWLARHLGACSACRKYREDLARLTEWSRAAAAGAEASAAALSAIRQEAIRRAAARPALQPVDRRLSPWGIPAWIGATAAVGLAITLSVLWLRTPGAPRGAGSAGTAARPAENHESSTWYEEALDEHIAEIGAWLAMISYDAEEPWPRADEDADSLAAELLELEESS